MFEGLGLAKGFRLFALFLGLALGHRRSARGGGPDGGGLEVKQAFQNEPGVVLLFRRHGPDVVPQMVLDCFDQLIQAGRGEAVAEFVDALEEGHGILLTAPHRRQASVAVWRERDRL
ncbi:MAG: hypothetical protein ACO1SX_06870 [Actinomycetota bacterium]